MRRTLTEAEVTWLRDNYPTTTNAECAKFLNISVSYMHRLIKGLNLSKTEEFMLEQHRANFRKADEVNRRNGYNLQRRSGKENADKYLRHYWPKKGESRWEKLTEEQKAETRRKLSETRNATIEAERRRIRWGLPQRTKLNLCEYNKPRWAARHRLTKMYGYVFLEKWVFGRAQGTKVNPKLEKKYGEMFKFKFKEDK